MSPPEKHLALLSDLGRPTMRGVRKCSNCGTYNGTRGLSCKNKSCNQVFKEREKKPSQSADSVKIITGSNIKVYSVRLRDRGPDYRGFVQLPLVQDEHGNPTSSVDQKLLASASRCYVDSCARNIVDIDMKADCCPHIKLSMATKADAIPLTLKNSVLNSLKVSNETKQAIWLLATDTSGPLVQRVSKSIMAVKCKPTVRHPLGFLHFGFFETSKGRAKIEHKFYCSCRQFKQITSTKQDMMLRRCVHFYACICAFGSDEKLSEEFKFYIDLDATVGNKEKNLMYGQECSFLDAPELNFDEAEVMAVDDAPVLEVDDEGMPVPNITAEELEKNADSVEVVISDDGQFIVGHTSVIKKHQSEDVVVQAGNALLTLQENSNTIKKASPNKPTIKVSNKKNVSIEENEVVISFHTWLASVTERINQTMHYQFSGTPDPLVFHTYQPFFDCLQQRISSGFRKRRLPNSTSAFIRRDALPLGMFTKYTWQVTNVMHAKLIFDTPEMPLAITRNFLDNGDGTFEYYDPPDLMETTDIHGKPIRPFELKTYLKIGNCSSGVNNKISTPLIIEWIPDILPSMHIGELRIQFEYGHQRNGIVEDRSQLVQTNRLPNKDSQPLLSMLLPTTEQMLNIT